MSRIAAVVTAAGESARMGTPKALLPWIGKSLLEHQVDTLLESGVDEVVVVLGHRALDLVNYVRGDQVLSVINVNYQQGKSTSVQLGLLSISPEADPVLLIGVDQPRTIGIVKSLIEAHIKNAALVTVPEFNGHRGHPIVLSRGIIPEFLDIQESNLGVRAVLDRNENDTLRVSFQTPIVGLDLNTPEEYHKALQLFG